METISADVVVIGAGGAGMSAAIHAADQDAHVVLLDKGPIGRSGATSQANISASAAAPDDVDAHAADIVRAGGGLADPELAYILARDATGRFEEWASWGVQFIREPDGQFRRTMSRGHTTARAISPGYGFGEQACRAMTRQLSRRTLVKALPHSPAVNLLTNDGEICGVLAWMGDRREPIVIEAPAVVIATGGAQELYTRSTTSPHLTGDGHAMALRAGAALTDMEFVLQVPVGLVRPRPRGISVTIMEPIRKVAGHLTNRYGDQFAEKVESDGSQCAWEKLSTLIAREAMDGRCNDDGTVYLGFSLQDIEIITRAFPSVIQALREADISLTDEFRVAPMAHFFPGGVEINTRAATDVPGLFAAGEAAGGMHGATRLGGDALASVAVFGAIAGVEAAKYAHSCSPPTRASMELRAAKREFIAVEDPYGRRRKVQEVMTTSAGALRHESALSAASKFLALEEPAPPSKTGSIVASIENDSIVLLARAICSAAMYRRETRGAHTRIDFPEPGLAFARSQRITLENERLNFGWKEGV